MRRLVIVAVVAALVSAGCGKDDTTKPTPTGACCTASGTCTVTTQANCATPAAWHPEWATCSPNPCPEPQAACCNLLTGSCTVTVRDSCAAPSTWHVEWSTCSPNPCTQPNGACCAPDGTCTVSTEAACVAPGAWHPEWPTCVPSECPSMRLFLDIPPINAAWNVDSTHVVVVEGRRDLRWSARRDKTAGEASAHMVVLAGTAQDREDYFASYWMAWFANGKATSDEWTGYGWPGLTLLDDDVVEPDEDLILELADPSPGWALDPVRKRVYVTIVDDDGVPPIAASFTWPMEVGESSGYEVSGGGGASDGFPGGYVIHETGSISIPTQRVFKGQTYAAIHGLSGDVLVRQEGSRIYVVPQGTLADPPPIEDVEGRRLWRHMPWIWFDAADPSLPYAASISDSSGSFRGFSYSVVNRGTTRIAIPSGIHRVQCLEIGWSKDDSDYQGEGTTRWYVADSIGIVALEDQSEVARLVLGATWTSSTAVLVDSPRLPAHSGDRR
jgi:hypothetical protein